MGKRHKIGGEGIYLPEEAQVGHVSRYLREAHNAGLDVRRVDARNRFLQAAAELDPDLLKSLQTDVLPHYDHRWITEEKLSELRHLHHGFEAVSRVKDLLSPFGLALALWLERWYLTETWAMNAALWTVESWMPSPLDDLFPLSPESLKWTFQNPRGIYPPIVGTFQPPAYEWHQSETPDAFIARTLASAESELRRWVAEQGAGYLPTPTKENLEHFRWCALRQVYSFSYEHIAEAVELSRQSVQGAAEDTFTLIGMTPRRLGRGRREGFSGQEYAHRRVCEIRRMIAP